MKRQGSDTTVSKTLRLSYKYRLYPTKEQIDQLTWTLDRCREVYNACLQERRDRYRIAIRQHPNFYDREWRKQATKEHAISLYDQQNQLATMKQDRTEYLELSAAHLLNDVCKRVDFAFKRFFDRVKKGQTPGYPRFKNTHRYDSFCYPDASGWKLIGKKLHLTRIGIIKVKLHRPVQGKIKTCAIKREGDHWYVVFSCEIEQPEPLSLSYEDVGIDLGVSKLATLSNGEAIEHPRHYRTAEKKLEILQQSLSRKKRGSNRRKKAVKRVGVVHRKVRNQRKDFLHKASRTLINRYQVLVFEDLQTANLVKRPKPKLSEEVRKEPSLYSEKSNVQVFLPNGASAKAGLNKSILDASWAEFVQYCTYKAEEAGRTVLQINPKNTSQICSGCGSVVKKALSERWHSCSCGCELDRDHNAALNILTLGHKELREGTACSDVSIPSRLAGVQPAGATLRIDLHQTDLLSTTLSQARLWDDAPG